MKWAVFILCIAAILPAAVCLRRDYAYQRAAWFIIGILPFAMAAIPQLDISLISWAGWPGYVRGAGFGALDAIALALFFSQPKSDRPLPFLLPMILYFGVAALSVFQARVPMAAMFYPWQLLRVFLFYVVVARASTERANIAPLLYGLAIGLCSQAVLVLYQRYGLGVLQTTGSFVHQNSLGLISNLILFPLFALFLSGKSGWIGYAATLAGCIIAVHTTSRATLGLAVAGLGLLFLISIARQVTPRKKAAGFLGLIFVAILSPVAIGSFEHRFEVNPLDTEHDERAAMIETAKNIVDDNPFGVGANNLIIVANTEGYYNTTRVGDRSSQVHNLYWMTAAETGYIGMAALIFLLFMPLKAAFVCGWRHRADRRGDLLLGCSVSLLILYIHSYFEWIFLTSGVQYIFAIELGLIAGLTQQLDYWRKSDDEARDADTRATEAASSDAIDPAIRNRDDAFWGIMSRGSQD